MTPKYNAIFIDNRVHVSIKPVFEGEPQLLSNAEMGREILYPVQWLVFYSCIPCQAYWAEYMEVNMN